MEIAVEIALVVCQIIKLGCKAVMKKRIIQMTFQCVTQISYINLNEDSSSFQLVHLMLLKDIISFLQNANVYHAVIYLLIVAYLHLK